MAVAELVLVESAVLEVVLVPVGLVLLLCGSTKERFQGLDQLHPNSNLSTHRWPGLYHSSRNHGEHPAAHHTGPMDQLSQKGAIPELWCSRTCVQDNLALNNYKQTLDTP